MILISDGERRRRRGFFGGMGFNLSDFFVRGGEEKKLFLQGVRGKCVRKM
jgi:hypothetical protein